MTNNPNSTVVSKNRRKSTFYDLRSKEVKSEESLRIAKNKTRSSIDHGFDGYPSLDSEVLVVNNPLIQNLLNDWISKDIRIESDSYISDLEYFLKDLENLRKKISFYKEKLYSKSFADKFIRGVEELVSKQREVIPKILLKIRQRKGYYFFQEIKIISEWEFWTDILSLFKTVRDDDWTVNEKWSKYCVKWDEKVINKNCLSFFLRLPNFYIELGYEEQLHALEQSGCLGVRQLKLVSSVNQDWKQAIREWDSNNLEQLEEQLDQVNEDSSEELDDPKVLSGEANGKTRENEIDDESDVKLKNEIARVDSLITRKKEELEQEKNQEKVRKKNIYLKNLNTRKKNLEDQLKESEELKKI